ncbi:hypothetical protein IFT73_16660 [Aeromicrobium sp. CFBP 8757]|uniref:hypothetical protein n=1 Tax=Aeromicrobium sp. CFBP 8757 TaxID=2775288 RepID=UPI001781B83E|nr:hypothetical protein [Aeromicrobium sp. CFBP 8757]MBD8608490.1 hypothetical protein [Aeromicrobium sp. CFBP 8757]
MHRTMSSIALLTTSLLVATAAVSGPAAASGSTGVTRDSILTAAAGIREPDIATGPATDAAVRQIVGRACAADLDGAAQLYQWRASSVDGPGVTGLVVRAAIVEPDGSGSTTSRICAFAAMTPSTSSEHRLSGSYTFGVEVGYTETRELKGLMSGSVQLTTVLSVQRDRYVSAAYLTAAGSSQRTVHTTVESRVETPKTKKQLKTARATLVKSNASAKRTYKKAVKAAHGSKAKKAGALKRYRASRARAEKVYLRATRTFVIKRTGHTDVESEAFTVKASNYEEIY